MEDFSKTTQYLASNIETLRKSRGFSQEQLAKLADIPRTTLTNFESGSGNPSLLNLMKLSEALHVGLEELLTRPRSNCSLTPAVDVPIQRRSNGQAMLFKLLPDKIKGLEIDRLELDGHAVMGGQPHIQGTKEYMIGLKGEIQVHVAGQMFSVKEGDVFAFPGDQRHSYRNMNTTKSAAMSIVVPQIGTSVRDSN